MFSVNVGLSVIRPYYAFSVEEEEHAQTEEQVNQDRVYAVDAAVVRVMKTR